MAKVAKSTQGADPAKRSGEGDQMANGNSEAPVAPSENGRTPAELLDEIERLRERFEDYESRLKLQSSCVDAVQAANDRVLKSQATTLDISRFVVWAIFGVIVLAIAGNGVQSWYQFSAIDKRSDELKEAIGKSETSTNASNKLQESIKSQLTDMQGAVEEHRLKSASLSGVIHESVMLLNIGQQRLAEDNPIIASAYARDVLKFIDAEAMKMRGDKSLDAYRDSLSLVKRPAMILLCQSLVRLHDVSGLRAVVEDLSTCECPEGAHYVGLLHLYDATDERTDRGMRTQKMDEAKESLETSLTRKPDARLGNEAITAHRMGNFDLVLLAAASLDSGNYAKCVDSCQEYLNAMPYSKDASSLGAKTQASVWIATTFKAVGLYLGQESSEIVVPDGCVSTAGLLTVIEGRSLENILKTVGETTDSKLKEFCAKASGKIKFLTALPCVVAPVLQGGSQDSQPVNESSVQGPPSAGAPRISVPKN